MKRSYESSFEMWLQFQNGKLDCKYTSKNIRKIIDTETLEFGYTFVDETENFYPVLWDTPEEAVAAMKVYVKNL